MQHEWTLLLWPHDLLRFSRPALRKTLPSQSMSKLSSSLLCFWTVLCWSLLHSCCPGRRISWRTALSIPLAMRRKFTRQLHYNCKRTIWLINIWLLRTKSNFIQPNQVALYTGETIIIDLLQYLRPVLWYLVYEIIDNERECCVNFLPTLRPNALSPIGRCPVIFCPSVRLSGGWISLFPSGINR